MTSTAPPDPRVFHRYSDAPTHRILASVGWCAAGFCVLIAGWCLLTMASPSDPCDPDGVGCGPEPTTFGVVGLVFFGLALVAAGWSVFWHLRDAQYRFQAPPNWPAPPPGWRPPRGWTPPPGYPKAPDGWKFWTL